jgi:inhibitor of KinA sporulation pathway (predicted exonuclease)
MGSDFISAEMAHPVKSFADMVRKNAPPLPLKPQPPATPMVVATSSDSGSEYDYLIVLDFEATCWENSSDHEIIEFPSVVVDIKTGQIIDRIEQFVKPKKNVQLSEFCKDLTSITQEQVNGGIPLKDALSAHFQFVQKYPKSLLVTAGDWDLKTMLPIDCTYNGLKAPNYYRRWVNLKVPFEELYKVKKKSSMTGMLDHLKMKLVGVHHRGIDDCVNIARIAIRLLADGWKPKVTYQLY